MSFWNNLLGLFGWGGDYMDDGHSSSSGTDMGCSINPASGLPMVGGCAGVDIEGNPYGIDFHRDDLWASIGTGIEHDSFMSTSFGDDSLTHTSDVSSGIDND